MRSKKQVRSKAAMVLALVLVVGGLAAVAGSFLRQMLAEKDDMKEYAELLETAQQSAGGEMRSRRRRMLPQISRRRRTSSRKRERMNRQRHCPKPAPRRTI